MGNCCSKVNDEDIPVTDVGVETRLNPRYLDWHEKGIFWEIEAQTGLFCWVHAVVDTVEGIYGITHDGQRIKLSKQELVDNLFTSNHRGVYDEVTKTYALSPDVAYHWIRDNGLSLEADYGSGKYEAEVQEPKERISGRKILYLNTVTRFFDEDAILTELNISPGTAIMSLDLDQMDFWDANAVYSISDDTTQGEYHSLVLSGYDDSASRNVYWVRDAIKSRTSNDGHYRVTRESAIQPDERKPIIYVVFPRGVSLE